MLILALLMFHGARAGDTLFVKKVYVGLWPVKVKSGYIIRMNDSTYQVNDRIVRLRKYEPAHKSKYKPSKIKQNAN